MKSYNFSSEDIVRIAKGYDVAQSDMMETFLCELLDISPDALYEELDVPTCVEFHCDPDLSKYVDSMLFDRGTSIASGKFALNGKTVDIDLVVSGDVSVTFKGEVYHAPSEFPEALTERIKANPNNWMYPEDSHEENDISVNLNNWFEYIDDVDGYVVEENLSKFSPDKVKEDMEYLAKQAFESSALNN